MREKEIIFDSFLKLLSSKAKVKCVILYLTNNVSIINEQI
jgi:hypothetical protein